MKTEPIQKYKPAPLTDDEIRRRLGFKLIELQKKNSK